jgi:hypothetical protein
MEKNDKHFLLSRKKLYARAETAKTLYCYVYIGT